MCIRDRVALARQRDPLGLAGFWGWFDELSPEQSAQVLAPVMNKLRSFLLRPDLRAVLGQTEPRFELSEIFGATAAPGRALLVRLPRGELGVEAATLLGSLVVHQVWQAVSYTHLRAHETVLDIVCRLLLEKKKRDSKECIVLLCTAVLILKG
mgnify:CR=1 FL=1